MSPISDTAIDVDAVLADPESFTIPDDGSLENVLSAVREAVFIAPSRDGWISAMELAVRVAEQGEVTKAVIHIFRPLYDDRLIDAAGVIFYSSGPDTDTDLPEGVPRALEDFLLDFFERKGQFENHTYGAVADLIPAEFWYQPKD